MMGKAYLDPTTVLQDPQFLLLVSLNASPAYEDKVELLALVLEIGKGLCSRNCVVKIDFARCCGVRVPKRWAA